MSARMNGGQSLYGLLKGLTGHATLSTTMTYYTGTTEADSLAVRAGLSAEFGDGMRTRSARATLSDPDSVATMPNHRA